MTELESSTGEQVDVVGIASDGTIVWRGKGRVLPPAPPPTPVVIDWGA
jgi:hypothetical protein